MDDSYQDENLQLPEIGIIDDSRAIFLAWSFSLRGQARLYHFSTPDALLGALAREPALLDRLRVLVIDHRFPGSQHSGVSLAATLRKKVPRPRLILSSRGVFSPEELASFDAVIDKGPIPLHELAGDN